MRKIISIFLCGLIGAFSFLAVSPALAVNINNWLNNHNSNQLDLVNIGTPSSEAGHDLQGWGPIEPQTHGGNWGQIASETSCGLCDSLVCDKALRVTYASNEPDDPAINGRMASLTLDPKKGSAKKIKMRVLDGVGDDDFMVFVKNKKGNNVLVYTYLSDPSTAEVWKIHEIDLTPFSLAKNKPLVVTIMATGSNWAQFGTYGQLGIDWISLEKK
ncbi:MAG: hypothetical protein PHG23_00685 [Candidatus Pacebacteria bacterium]|nr:hypothetical protein [Candidatus Paceibacterota bacterium]